MSPETISNPFSEILEQIAQIRSDVYGRYYGSEACFCNRLGHYANGPAFNAVSSSRVRTVSREVIVQSAASFSAPVASIDVLLAENFKEILRSLHDLELRRVTSSELSEELWNGLVEWFMTTAHALGISMSTVVIGLNNFSRYLGTLKSNSNPDFLAVASASLLIATKVNCEGHPSIERFASCCCTSPKVIRDFEAIILKALKWKVTAVPVHEFLSILNENVFQPYLSISQRQAQLKLQKKLIQGIFYNLSISHCLPSSIAFGCVLTLMALLDPCPKNNKNTISVIHLAQNLNLNLNEIAICVRAFVDLLNNIFA